MPVMAASPTVEDELRVIRGERFSYEAFKRLATIHPKDLETQLGRPLTYYEVLRMILFIRKEREAETTLWEHGIGTLKLQAWEELAVRLLREERQAQQNFPAPPPV